MSHVTCSQLQAMYNGDQACKKVLIEHGFRLPSAADNRPLKGRVLGEGCRTATSPPLQGLGMEVSGGEVAQQVSTPQGLDPVVEVRPTSGQVDDLLGEIREPAARTSVLATTLTKRMAEDLTVVAENEVRVRYLHSEIHSIERIEIIQICAWANTTCWWVNLLREGLIYQKWPMAILDADKEGFPCAERPLIQPLLGCPPRGGRGAALCRQHDRPVGQGHLRNRHAGRSSRPTTRSTAWWPLPRARRPELISASGVESQAQAGRPDADLVEVGKAAQALENDPDAGLALEALPELIDQLEAKTKEAAKKLDFEEAANLRDRVKQLRQKTGTH